MSPSLDDLVRAGRIEAIPADGERARASLEEAERHLASAALIADADPNGAYALLYDAARKALAALMLADGYRATNRVGAHEAVGLYGADRLGAREASVRQFDRIRRKRNRTEYGVRAFGAAEIGTDLGHARRIVAAVVAEMR